SSGARRPSLEGLPDAEVEVDAVALRDREEPEDALPVRLDVPDGVLERRGEVAERGVRVGVVDGLDGLGHVAGGAEVEEGRVELVRHREAEGPDGGADAE